VRRAGSSATGLSIAAAVSLVAGAALAVLAFLGIIGG
jgi:hypothetical protein